MREERPRRQSVRFHLSCSKSDLAVVFSGLGRPSTLRLAKNTMTPHEFAACVARQKEDMLSTYFDPDSGAAVATQIAAMGLSDEQAKALRTILDGSLTDAFYTLLLGLDGAASIGGLQSVYELRAEDGTLLTGGELEGAAWEHFHGDKPE